MAHVNDVARYILECQGGHVSTMKLQKLVYYSQAWNLVWEGKSLFDARIIAWINGPVIPELYKYHRGEFTVNRDMFPGASDDLTADEKETINAVLDAYGHLDGQQLSDLSHSERPWHEAYDTHSKEITHKAMQEFYNMLL